MARASTQSAEPQNPYVPPGPPPFEFEEFAGINTSTTRPGVKNEQMWWCEGLFPLGPNFLRTLPDVGTALWTAPSGTTIEFFGFANIGPTPYMIGFTSNGAVYAVNTITAVATLIASAGTIVNPSRTTVGLGQYGSQYVIIVSAQSDGYFLWDGTLFYKAGTLAPGVTITDGGAGYGSATAAVSGGSGSGATFTVQVSGGIVTGITITNPGSGWAAGDVVTLAISGSHSVQATGTVQLMPLGISGTMVETYSGHVWVGLGATIAYTAPGSVSDFSTTNGGGDFTSTDSFLRVGYIELKQTNGFLYLIADSSVNYISGVQTSGTPITTTFTNQNADPEVGTPYPGTVDVFNRNILFANSFGAHVVYGAAAAKISEPLDGVYSTVPNFGGFNPSAAKAIIYGKKVWILLVPIISPVTQTQINVLFLWNGKIWFSSQQSVNLLYIQHQEINSVITAWGTDGASVYPLFDTPSINFRKVVQSKLWRSGGIQIRQATNRFWGVVQYNSVQSPTINVTIDNEFGIGADVYALNPAGVLFFTVTGLPVVFHTQGGAPVTFFVAGIAVLDSSPVGQQGVFLGMTLSTNCDDVSMIAFMIQPEVVEYRG